ncbi:MAG: hypothetical protein J0L93_03855 [Deltaproteobacteria bacterium]|nr:hypothetical protein [Deltaproteobacteria bacterium]
MTKNKKMISAAVLGLLSITTAGVAHAEGHDAGAKVKCEGANGCKGKGSCKGAKNECKGHNACKGQGWTEMSKADCDKARAEHKK